MSTERVLADLVALSEMGRKLPGTPAEAAACRFIADAVQSMGLQPVVHEFDAFIGWPIRSEVWLGDTCLPATGVAFGADSSAAGVIGQLVDCSGGIGGCLTGQVAVVDGMPKHSVLIQAARAGAIGLIAVSPGPERHFVSVSPIWGPPGSRTELAALPSIPAVQVSRQDGALLRAAAGEKVTLVAETRAEWRPVCMPAVHIQGREDRFLLMGAHFCSWAEGATDNAAGAALLLEIARRYAERPPPRYGLRLVWWTGHEQGAYAGSTWYADQMWRELHRDAIGYLNVDIVGSSGATTKAVRNTSAELASFVTETVARVAGSLPPHEDAFVRHALRRADTGVDPRRPARNSDQSFLGIGLSSLQVSAFLPAASPDHLPDSGLAWWWHTEEDTPSRCDPAVLAVDLSVHEALVAGLIEAPILPLDIAAIEGDLVAALRFYGAAAPNLDVIDELQRDVSAFGFAARRLQTCSASASLLDRVRLGVVRALSPVMFHADSAFSPDTGRTSRMLPGLSTALRLSTLPPQAAHMARVTLRRQANRIASALHVATAGIEAALSTVDHGS